MPYRQSRVICRLIVAEVLSSPGITCPLLFRRQRTQSIVALGNIGQTVSYTQPVRPAGRAQLSRLWSLVNEMKAGSVQTLLILGGNPVFDAPSDMGFRDALKNSQEHRAIGSLSGRDLRVLSLACSGGALS